MANDNTPREMEPVHEILGLIELRRKSYKMAVVEYRLAELTQWHDKCQLAPAPEGAGMKAEARALYPEVNANNFNTVDVALLRR